MTTSSIDLAKSAATKLTDAQIDEFRFWITTTLLPDRQNQKAVNRARVADAEAFWASKPEMKPIFETAPFAVTPAKEGTEVTKAQLLKVWEKATWTQPSSPFDSYPPSALVRHGDGIFRNTTSAMNANQPGDTSNGWESITSELLDQANYTPEAYNLPAETVEDWQTGHAYQTGDRVAYKGATYTVTQDHTSQDNWKPDIVTSFYSKQ